MRVIGAGMATDNTRASSTEQLYPNERTSGRTDYAQLANHDGKLMPGLLRCCDGQQTRLDGESRREFLSSKDASKRKKVNRIAKLKQCKLDARREQWLSQSSHSRPKQDKQYQCVGSKDDKDVRAENATCVEQGSSNQDETQSIIARLAAIPGGTKFHGGEEVGVSVKNEQHGEQRKVCTQGSGIDHQFSSPYGSRCASSSNSSGSGSEDNDVSFSLETEDDWEVAADALTMPGSSVAKVTSHTSEPPFDCPDKKSKAPSTSDLHNGMLKPDYKCKGPGFRLKARVAGGRAWRPDDVSRPPTLPRLAKQHSFPLESSAAVWSGLQQGGNNVWGPPPAPSYCPICTEELDVTDSSFFPCSCGFRLCLFCHHKISSDDGRCPGCRKAYSPDVAMKLSRTTTFWLRV